MRVCVSPFYSGTDQGDGGIRRVVEAQEKYLPQYDIEVVRDVNKADVLAVHAGNGDFNRVSLPYVAHCHGLYWDEYDWGHHWFYGANKQVIDSMLRADYVTAPSKWVANIIERGAWINPTVLYHGISADDWPQVKKHANYILWNKTRIDPICDPEPVNTLASRNPSWRFATTFGEQRDNVTVLGLQPYELAKQVVQNATLYLATTRETFGIGTLEAMCTGVPVVGWAWGGQKEFIVNGENGWLATPGNYDELEYGINYCTEHRVRIAKAARDTVLKRFTWQRVMKRYAALYTKAYTAREEERPKVAVIITNYKLESYLQQAVHSARVQEGIAENQVEIIVVNDASPTWDTQLEQVLVEQFGARVIHNEKNLYLAGALNAGIAATNADYIVCLDADNVLTERSLATLAISLDNDKSIDIAYGALIFRQPNVSDIVSGWPGEFNYQQQIVHRNQIPSTCMYRRRVWERSGGYRIRCRTAEDADFWCRVTSLGFNAKKVTDMPTFVYNERSDSMSHVERDWGWHYWYTWNRDAKLTPFAAPQQTARDIRVPTYEPVKVSVVIPVGPGHEHLVVDAVDSMVAQTFVKWECIVVNDTGAVLPWIHPFVKVIDSGAIEGNVNRTARARNKGIEQAQAKYVVLLDADDYLQPTALQRMYETITSADQAVAYAYTDWYVAETKEKHEAPDYSCENILDRLNHAVTCIYKKDAWQKVGGFDESILGWEDWDFIIALNAEGYCGTHIPYPLLQYRINSGTRRNGVYAKLDHHKEEIKAKWSAYISGEKKMPCGCQQSASATRRAGDGAIGGTEDMTKLEYTGPNIGPLTYNGKISKQTYVFGTEPEHSVKYVLNSDVPSLLTIEGFHYYDESNNEPVLEALGPPERDESERSERPAEAGAVLLGA
jgi:glycosyltransferase involved in cell wall biosynthesis